jgi:hypothetical protein
MRRKEFTTATARRLADPIVWAIDGEDVIVNPDLEIGDLGPVMEIATSVDFTGVEGRALVDAIAAKHAELAGALRGCVSDGTREVWDRVGKRLDLMQLVEMSTDLVAEATGKDPSSLPASSPGSPTRGQTSTAGALPEASTPQPSPSID